MATRKPNNFQRFRELSDRQQQLAATILIERMFPNYQLFSEVTPFGDVHIFRSLLDLLWEKLAKPSTKIDFDKQSEKFEPIIPELNHFDMMGIYPAIDSCTAVISLIAGIETKESRYFLDVAKVSQATVSKIIEISLAEEGEDPENINVRDHELMQYEMAWLGELLDEVESVGKITTADIKGFKAFALKDGITNIGLDIGE